MITKADGKLQHIIRALWAEVKYFKTAATLSTKTKTYLIQSYNWDTMHLCSLRGSKTVRDQILMPEKKGD